ncbi:MAG: glycosyltransferase family 2 protein [Planctomycetota bacterium]|nr:MAG: glycosyltransferase family 2 protein [Planctomycetota bacterium]
MDLSRIVAVIPAFEAQASIAKVVEETRKILPRVLVVDDGSQDGTGDLAEAAGAEVLRHSHNQGKGAALRSAFRFLFSQQVDAVVTLDADGQHLPSEIPKLLDGAASGAWLVLGTRDRLFAEMSPLRRRSNGISSFLISLAAGKRFHDIQTGFRFYRRELIEATGFPEDRFDAESALVVRAARRRFAIVTVPIELGFVDGRSTSHYRPLVDSFRIGRSVLRARFLDPLFPPKF